MISSKVARLSAPIVEDDNSVSKVLTNDGLLSEILPRLHCPTCYVRAALASKRWLRNASNQATIRTFRSQQSPHLLGIYVLSDGFSRPEFVPLPDASGSELEPALRHGKFGFDDLDTSALSVYDCRNERILYGFGPSFELPLGPAMQIPLRYPGEITVELPRLPFTICAPHAMLLPDDDDDDDSSCYRVDIEQRDQMVDAKVFVLRAGSWSIHCSASADLARSPEHILQVTLLMRGAVYMLTTAGYILALDLATAKFSIIDLPEGVQLEYFTNLAPCRGDDSTLYLFHVSGDELTVWLKRMNDHGGDGNSASEWILRDTISLLQTCGHLAEQSWKLEDRPEAFVSVVGVGDNAEFVFLELEQTGVIVYMHLKSRKAKKVYQRHPYNDFGIRVLPFMMVWPAVLPEL